MKKIVFSLMLCLVVLYSNATGHYVSVSGASGNAGTQAAPWNFANLSTKTLTAGDTIYLKRGDVFQGTWTTVNSGTAAAPIIVWTYGSGANPQINGFTTVSSWTLTSTPGVYKSQPMSPQTDIKYIYLDGKPAGKGRYPNIDASNGGWLMFESFSNANPYTITDNELNTTSIDATWVGADIKIRTGDYTIDGANITAINMSTKTITWDGTKPVFQHPTGANYGYFITNSLKTLDEYSEWYFNPSDKCVYMYFGSKNPDLHDVRATTIDALLNPNHNYYQFNNIDFIGANMYLVVTNWGGATTTTFNNCNFKHSGNLGLVIEGRTDLTMNNCVVQYCNSTGINVGFNCVNPRFFNCQILDIGVIAANIFCDGTYQRRYGYGIFAGSTVGTGCTIQGCRFINVGYMPIFFDHSNNFVYKNYVNTFCTLMDDGGGIYTGSFGNTPQTNNIIRRNIVLNAIGAPLGKPSNHGNMANGIYTDDGSSHCTVDSNFVWSCGQYGIYIHNTDSSTFTRNKVGNGGLSQIGLQDDDLGQKIQNLSVSNNVLFSYVSTQLSFRFATAGLNSNNNNTVSQFGTFNSDTLCNPFNESGNIGYYDDFSVPGVTFYTYSQLKSTLGIETSSAQTPLTISKIDNIVIQYAEDGDRTFLLFGTYKRMSGSSVSNSITIIDHTGEILAK